MNTLLNFGVLNIALGAIFLYQAYNDRSDNPTRTMKAGTVCLVCGILLLIMYFAWRN
jgi:hypothetical protein